MNARTITTIMLAASVGLAVFAIPNAIAVFADEKTAVIFLLDKACKPSLVEQYTERFVNAWVVCTDFADWTEARENLYGFEAYYHVVYVTQTNQHPLADKGVQGEAFFRDGQNFAYSVNSPLRIAHELEHLKCGCHFTFDGRHDGERELYPQLWEDERGKEKR